MSPHWLLLAPMPNHPCCCDSDTTAAAAAAAAQCLYELVVKTAAVEGAGTDARISLKLSSADGRSVLEVGDLESWGWLGADYDYFEPGDLDIFGRRHECLATMPCRMLLVSDGSSDKPDWYPNMVEIIQITTDLSVTVRKFFLHQWLAADRPPYQLFAYQDLCANDAAAGAA
ncbi:PLAT domain-containing protein 3-like [Miscanthus floridulus]|uniref:PLAT domain-containing protein 3-like n=1 Tax=Miscanthus floridulus TaxID=154761 RepID=UPI003459291A